jgi:hypothetical protein
VGVSTIAGAFDQGVVEAMCELNERPIIFPLSNPTSKSECTFEDAFRWVLGCVAVEGREAGDWQVAALLLLCRSVPSPLQTICCGFTWILLPLPPGLFPTSPLFWPPPPLRPPCPCPPGGAKARCCLPAGRPSTP